MWRSCTGHFASDEGGAVTVDWVVLTAAVLILGAVVAIPIASGAVDLSEETGSTLGEADVPELDLSR